MQQSEPKLLFGHTRRNIAILALDAPSTLGSFPLLSEVKSEQFTIGVYTFLASQEQGRPDRDGLVT